MLRETGDMRAVREMREKHKESLNMFRIWCEIDRRDCRWDVRDHIWEAIVRDSDNIIHSPCPSTGMHTVRIPRRYSNLEAVRHTQRIYEGTRKTFDND